jgi:hypothetical protein
MFKHARYYCRYYWLLLAEGHLHRRLFGQMLGRIDALPVPSDSIPICGCKMRSRRKKVRTVSEKSLARNKRGASDGQKRAFGTA